MDDATSDQMCKRRDSIALSIFRNKWAKGLQEGSANYHVGMSSDFECDCQT